MNTHSHQIIREELLRSIAWIGLGIVGWPIVIAEIAWLDATALTVFGLPLVTWAVLTGSAIGIRSFTSTEMQIRTPTGLTIFLILGIMLGGVSAVYLVTAGGYSVLLVTSVYVAVSCLTVLWYWFVRPPTFASKMKI